MTLIINEIYFIDGDIKKSFIVSSADTRITYRKSTNPKKKYKSGCKLFKIEYLNGVVSFWGSLNIFNENGKEELLCTWLPKFITSRHYYTELIDFVNDLREELNRRMYKSYLIEEPSGFHFARYKIDGTPEFIHFSNCTWNPEKSKYENLINQYGTPSNDFLERDAVNYGWDGATPTSFSAINKVQVYRNGDIRGHVSAWEHLDKIYENLFSYEDFKKPYAFSDIDVTKLTKQKLTFISTLYDSWGSLKNVGAPWDVKVLRPKTNS